MSSPGEVAELFQALGFLVFGAVGAFFSWRSWSQKNAELKELYYDRRQQIYEDVASAMRLFLLNDRSYGWMELLPKARRRASFLCDGRTVAVIDSITHNIDEAVALRESDNAEDRRKATDHTRAVNCLYAELHSAFEKYLTP